MAGEKLFNIERAYKGICLQKVVAVEKMCIVTDFELFRTCASSGHNPRRFVAFNDEHLKKLENSDDRRRLAEKFGLPLLEGKFDTTQNLSQCTFFLLLQLFANRFPYMLFLY